jgi:hypothetical protein
MTCIFTATLPVDDEFARYPFANTYMNKLAVALYELYALSIRILPCPQDEGVGRVKYLFTLPISAVTMFDVIAVGVTPVIVAVVNEPVLLKYVRTLQVVVDIAVKPIHAPLLS